MQVQSGQYFRGHTVDDIGDARSQRGVMPKFSKEKYSVIGQDGQPTGQEVDVELVQLIVGGDNMNSPFVRVRDSHKQKFAAEYRAFQEGLDQLRQGMKLEDLPGITAEHVRVFNFYHVYTVETLASLPDSALSNIGLGARDLRAKAQTWLKRRDETAQIEATAAENAVLNAKMAKQAEQMAAMQAMLQQLMNGQPQATLTVAATAPVRRRGPNKVKRRKVAAPAPEPVAEPV